MRHKAAELVTHHDWELDAKLLVRKLALALGRSWCLTPKLHSSRELRECLTQSSKVCMAA